MDFKSTPIFDGRDKAEAEDGAGCRVLGTGSLADVVLIAYQTFKRSNFQT